MKPLRASLLRILSWVLLAGVALQLYFIARIGLMAWVDPQSTTFQRSEMAQLAVNGEMTWKQQWVSENAISDHLKRAVIASEDGDFLNHSGIDWEAINSARSRNAAAEARAQTQTERLQRQQKLAQERAQRRMERLQKAGRPVSPALQAAASGASTPAAVQPKIVGASTISQQLAKNLFLSPSRSLWRKGNEAVITLLLENLWSKQRIFEVYLNVIEWGNGVFGAEAAARHYFSRSAQQLTAAQAARLAGMVPNPRYYDTHRNAPGLARKTAIILARMQAAKLPQ